MGVGSVKERWGGCGEEMGEEGSRGVRRSEEKRISGICQSPESRDSPAVL